MALFTKSTQLPKQGTPTAGLAHTNKHPHGISVTAFGPLSHHLTLPVVILVTPLDDEDTSDFDPLSYADLADAERDGAWRAEGIPVGTPLPRVGGVSRGWWVSEGILLGGVGRVSSVLEDVVVAWVDGSGSTKSEGKSR